jgi:hypothetical protein
MGRISRLGATIAIAVGVGALLAAGTATAAHPIRLQPFAVDSGDACRYGTAAGQLAFRAVHPPELPAVQIWGTLVDRPLSSDPTNACRDDGWYSIAVFTAYANIRPVDREVVRVDNGSVDIRVVLGDSPSIPQLSLVVIQVCRTPLFGPAVIVCGKPQQFTP